MSNSDPREKATWKFSHVSAFTDNVRESFTDEEGKIHYRWLYPDGKVEYICSCHRFLNR